MTPDETAENRSLSLKIASIFDEVRTTHATHVRRIKELATVRSSSTPVVFCNAFCQALVPIFSFQRKTASAERVIKFASVFACFRGGKADSADEFLEAFVRFLLVAAAAADRTARFRACQMISEIIMLLPDDAEVSSDIWDEVIELLKLRVGDKVTAIRTFAIRALARFVNDRENEDILELLLDKLTLEQNGDVRKIIVLSMPLSVRSLPTIIDCTLDVSEAVRKAAYYILSSKFPLQSLSIKLRTTILQRGLADRSAAVAKECLKLIKDEWLQKYCNDDPIELLKFLDVETYESVGVLVMATLLKEGLIKLKNGQTIGKFFISKSDSTEGRCSQQFELMDAESALFWRMVSSHLHTKAQNKGSDAAVTTGTESEVYAAETMDINHLLDCILPDSVSEYVELVNAHIAAGPNYRFVSRQLLLLGAVLDFSDTSNRKVASEFVEQLLNMGPDHELDENGIEVVIGDGFSLGGERDWSSAVAELAKKVHSATGEFEDVVLKVVEGLARPCRERIAECKQWLHCLAVVALLLENETSLHYMQGKAIDPHEILHSLLLPGAKHANLDVQRASIRCLGLFALLERKPSESTIKQLICSFVKGPPSITIMASKALLDLGIWHGPAEMDKVMNYRISSTPHDHELHSTLAEFCDRSEDLDIKLLDLLFAGIDHDWNKFVEVEENKSVPEILGEGLAKILLLSKKFPGCDTSMHHVLLAKLICLYFRTESEKLQRLKQSLSVFFEHYPSLSTNHKKCVSRAFIPVMRSLWPGLNGNAVGSTLMISNMRKRAVQASRFMLQMMQVPLFVKDKMKTGDEICENPDVEMYPSPDFDSGEEGLAIQIAVEVASFHAKKTAAEKTYLASLCRILVLLEFRVREQGAIKLMRSLLNQVRKSIAAEKDVAKELKQMAERLEAIDRKPEEKLLPDQSNHILGRLELTTFNFDEEACMEVPPTPAPPSTQRRNRARRRARDVEEESSSDEDLPVPIVPGNPSMSRLQRASKAAAMLRMTAKPILRIDENDGADINSDVDDAEDETGSEVNSEDESESFNV